ncbi:MAG TPA: IPTL-CTERM sorting domain-containing protein [Thermoanaerobaculia bacterium]
MKSVIATVSRNLIVMLAGLAIALPAMAQPLPSDVITVGTTSGSGVVDVPVYIRDTSSTPLGIDQPAGSRIQSYSIRVTYAPASAVQSISFSRDGITAPLTPTFESSPAVPGSISLLGNFDETTNLIPFTSNATLPGNQVAHLLVTIAPGTAPGTNITLTLDPVLTQLTDEGGTPATIETVANSRLTLVNGAILVTSNTVPTLGEWALGLLAIGLAFIAVRLRMS